MKPVAPGTLFSVSNSINRARITKVGVAGVQVEVEGQRKIAARLPHLRNDRQEEQLALEVSRVVGIGCAGAIEAIPHTAVAAEKAIRFEIASAATESARDQKRRAARV